MTALYFLGAVLFLALGHLCKAHRWRSFVELYEKTPQTTLVSALSAGYLVNFYVPFYAGDLCRIWISGRRMENGYGYATATIIVDRCLDVLVVGAIFSVLALALCVEALKTAAISYLILIGVLLVLAIFAVVFNGLCKKISLRFCSLFNERIKFRLLFFLWSLISSFKDVFRKVRKGRLLLETAAMWLCYLASYWLVAAMLHTGFTDIFLMMFGVGSLGQSTFAATNGIFSTGSELLLCAYILAPLPLLLGASLLLSRKKRQTPLTRQLLPQLKPDEQLQFLNLYFAGKDRKPLQEYLTMNRDVGILRDYSSGSDATTMLCIKENDTIFRKYAFGTAADKLEGQAKWLKRNAGKVPMTTVCDEKRSEFAFCYDMKYDSQGIGMFQYIYSHTTAQSWEILETMLHDLRSGLYPEHGERVSAEAIETYIDSKVTANLDNIRQCRAFRALTEPAYLTINGVRCRNLPLLLPMLEKSRLTEIFSNDTLSEVHGDLTVENIICYNGGAHESPYYLIDPNVGNPIESPNIDYAKLLQSLHGRYEFLELSPSVTIGDGQIDFLLPDTSEYRRLYELLHEWLTRNFDRETVRSIYYHEIVHWLRLLPYRVRRNEATAARYYAALILVMNDVWTLFEETT